MDGSGVIDQGIGPAVTQARYQWSLEDDSLDWSEGSAEALGVDKSHLPVRSSELARIAGRAAPRDRDAFIALARIGALPQEVTKTFEYPITDRRGGPRWFEEKIVFSPATPKDGKTAACVGLLRDVTERNRSAPIDRDSLTGLLSRSGLSDRLSDVLAHYVGSYADPRFAVIGLDNLSTINSAFGYDVADHVITQVGARLANILEPGEQIGRIGGGKFGVVLTNDAQEGLWARMQEFRAAVRGEVIVTASGPVTTTVCVGGVYIEKNTPSAQDLMAAGLDALNEAKQAGPDSQSIFAEAPEKRVARNRDIALASELSAALKEDRIAIAFQPIVDAKDPDRVSFYECLARIKKHDGELIAAGQFMPLAEKLGLVRLLDRRMLSLALETLRQHPRLRRSVYLSPATTHDSEWLAIFETACIDRPDLGERLIFDVTETMAIADQSKAASFIRHIRSYGASVAVDDFGAGYTSFRHFKYLPMDMVKIDGSFIRDVLENADNQLFVKTLLSISKHFDMLCVAEFVDSTKTAAYLRKLGIDCLQGFHFGEPVLELPETLRDKPRRAARKGSGPKSSRSQRLSCAKSKRSGPKATRAQLAREEKRSAARKRSAKRSS